MKVFRSIEEVNFDFKPVATIGVFDGVHLGHQEVLKHLIGEATKRKTKSLLITFDPHPRIVLNKDAKQLRLINNPTEKIEILSETGLDYLLILPFTYDFSKTSARDFIKSYLIDKLNICAVTIGYDHHFGRMNGEYEDVETLLKSMGIDVVRIPEKDVKNIAVSSTKIRKAIETGEMHHAKELLGYEYSLCGTVVHGNKVGRSMGFPTANIMLEYKLKLLPADGVYIVKAILNNKSYKGMLNIGYRPTLQSNEKTIEVHLLNFDSLIYGDKLKIKVLKKIRSEIAFENIDLLKVQLEKDKKVVINYFEV